MKRNCLKEMFSASFMPVITYYHIISIFSSRFLATGESYRSLAFSYRIFSACISTVVPTVLQALKTRLLPLNMPPPEEIDWEQKESEFWKRRDFPNVVAALDGYHVRIVAPNNTCFLITKNIFLLS